MARKPVDIKQFRRAVSILKKQGLIKNVDARSATPEMVRQGRQLRETVKRYDDIVSGKAQAVTLPPKKVSEYRKAGYSTTKAPDGSVKILVPKDATSTVKVTPKKEIEVKTKAGVKSVKKAVPYRSLDQWLSEMASKADELDKMKSSDAFWGYKIEGHNSWRLYREIGDLIKDLRQGSISGTDWGKLVDTASAREQKETFQALEIIQVPREDLWPAHRSKKREKAGGVRPVRRKDDATRKRDAYQQMKAKGGKEYEAYKRAARARSKRARKKKGAKKRK